MKILIIVGVILLLQLLAPNIGSYLKRKRREHEMMIKFEHARKRRANYE